LIREALDTVDVKEVVSGLAAAFVSRLPCVAGGQVEAMLRQEPLQIDTVVQKHPGLVYHLAETGGRVRLIVAGGYKIEAAQRAGPALRDLLGRCGPFRIRDMHDSLAAPAKLAFAERLVSAGVLQVVTTEEA
jgi:hypothetical protein